MGLTEILANKAKEQTFIVVLLLAAVIMLGTATVYLWVENKRLHESRVEILQNISKNDLRDLIDREIINQDQIKLLKWKIY